MRSWSFLQAAISAKFPQVSVIWGTFPVPKRIPPSTLFCTKTHTPPPDSCTKTHTHTSKRQLVKTSSRSDDYCG